MKTVAGNAITRTDANHHGLAMLISGSGVRNPDGAQTYYHSSSGILSSESRLLDGRPAFEIGGNASTRPPRCGETANGHTSSADVTT